MSIVVVVELRFRGCIRWTLLSTQIVSLLLLSSLAMGVARDVFALTISSSSTLSGPKVGMARGKGVRWAPRLPLLRGKDECLRSTFETVAD